MCVSKGLEQERIQGRSGDTPPGARQFLSKPGDLFPIWHPPSTHTLGAPTVGPTLLVGGTDRRLSRLLPSHSQHVASTPLSPQAPGSLLRASHYGWVRSVFQRSSLGPVQSVHPESVEPAQGLLSPVAGPATQTLEPQVPQPERKRGGGCGISGGPLCPQDPADGNGAGGPAPKTFAPGTPQRSVLLGCPVWALWLLEQPLHGRHTLRGPSSARPLFL